MPNARRPPVSPLPSIAGMGQKREKLALHLFGKARPIHNRIEPPSWQPLDGLRRHAAGRLDRPSARGRRETRPAGERGAAATERPGSRDAYSSCPHQRPIRANNEAHSEYCSSARANMRPRLRFGNANSMRPAIRLKTLLCATILLFAGYLAGPCFVQAGFFTFYFPNILKPKGFGELTDMIDSLDAQMNETRDIFSDTQYFWGQLQQLDSVQSDYPEDSVCSEVFPMFRDLAIAYVYTDFEHYMKPFQLFRAHLVKKRNEWYPAGLDSKAALPREWEQNLHEEELELKIGWLQTLATTKQFKDQRERLNEIWKNVRRGLDTSVPCIYLRYAHRQIAEDINQVALETNLEAMREALKVLRYAYSRIKLYKASDRKAVNDIEDELVKLKRFTIHEE